MFKRFHHDFRKDLHPKTITEQIETATEPIYLSSVVIPSLFSVSAFDPQKPEHQLASGSASLLAIFIGSPPNAQRLKLFCTSPWHLDRCSCH